MIKISRAKKDVTGRKIAPSRAWFARAEIGIAQALRDGPKHRVSKALYADAQVKIALEKLFHNKCAYCETPVPRSDWDVEHFRPKKRVFERIDHPGYYWLCYDWINLLPSCTRCNQHRKAQATWAGHPGTAGGKADRFPLSKEASRVMAAPRNRRNLRRALNREARLLLDPCKDEPSSHLAFDILGQASSVAGSAMGNTSIDVFNLNEPRLVKRRRTTIRAAIAMIRACERLDAHNTALPTLVADVVNILGDDEQGYAAAVRAIARDPDAFGLTA